MRQSRHFITEIQSISHSFTQAFGSLSSDQLNWKPNTDSWSIAQITDHLITTNETYYPVIRKLREGNYSTPFHSKIPFVTSFFGNFILKSVTPDRRKKIKTFPIWEPGQSHHAADILQQFATHQTQLATLIEKSDDLLEAGTVISSPANRFIVYSLEKAFEIIVTHEKRHYQQALEVLDLLKTKDPNAGKI